MKENSQRKAGRRKTRRIVRGKWVGGKEGE